MAALTVLLRRWRRSDAGAEFVEFALAFPLLLLVVMGILDFGLMFQQYEVITNAAREGARVAVLPNYSAADVQTRVDQYVSAGMLSSGGAVTTTVGAAQRVTIGANCMATITVNVSYPHVFAYLAGIAKYFNSTFGRATLRASSTMRVEISGASCS